jgi:hypothetical protein
MQEDLEGNDHGLLEGGIPRGPEENGKKYLASGAR